jgi:hypothetical protein
VIYFQSKDGKHVILLNHAELDLVKRGKPVVPHTNAVIIGYTPDEDWTKQQLLEIFNAEPHTLEPERLKELLLEGLKREVIDV